MGIRNVFKFRISHMIADFLFNSHLYHKAIDMYKEAQILLNEIKVENCNDVEIVLHYRLALSHVRINQLKEALENYQQLLKVNDKVRNRVWEVKAYRGISEVHRLMGQHVQSIFYERKLLEIAKETANKRAEIEANLAMGHAYYNLGKQGESIKFQNDALKICREIGDRKAEGRVLCGLGNTHKDLAQYHEAISCLERSLEIFRDTGDYKEEGDSYQSLGMTYHEKGDLYKALECHFKSLELMAEYGDEFEVGISYNNIGTTYNAICKYREALEYFKKTLEIMRKCGNKTTLGKAHHSLGLCYTSLGQYEKAIEHQVEAVKLLEEIGYKFEKGRAYSLLGNLYNTIGHKKEAMDSFKKAIKCSQAIGDRRVESNAYRGLGDVCVCLAPHSDQGEKYIKKALEIAKEIGDKTHVAESYTGLGFCYMCCGRFEESVDNFNLGIPIMQEIGDKSGEAGALINLGSVYQTLGKLKKAKQLQQKALQMLRKIGNRGKEQEALYMLGVCNKKDGELKKAHDCFTESITCAERTRELLQDKYKLSLDRITFASYYGLCSLHITQGNVPEALCTAERGRARALVDLLSKNYGIQGRDNSHEIFVNSIRNLSINNQSTIIFMALVDGNIFFWIVEGGEIQFKLSKFELGEEIKIVDHLKVPRRRLVLECEDRSLSAYYRKHPSPAEMKDKSRQRLVEEEEENEESSLHLLYEKFFAPVADLVQRQDVIIVPEGYLFMVPFCALHDTDGRFLSETFRIRLIPSLTALKLIQACPDDYHSATGALIVGDPTVHPRTGLPPLPEARKEAQEIAELLGVSATVGDEASKTQVLRRIREVSLIHIAAHGDAERGEIALAPSCSSKRIPRKEDFMLTMEDVAKVGIRAKLVVLSCCHSGKGEVMQSEGVVGISRAFLASGARSVLVSLWAVDDKATKEFMIRFYGHLARDKLSASEALHQTMKWMRESKRYIVKDWAPFVLIGEDVTLDL